MTEESSFINTIVPLYISSKDRVPGSTSSADFKIKLRKNLQNIETIKVSALSIPSVINTVNSGNNKFTFGFFTGSNDYNIQTDTLTLTTGDYTYTSLATEFQSKLNTSTVSTNNGLTWSVVYNSSAEVYDITISKSVSGDWSIQIVYNHFADVIGIGDANFTYGYFNITVSSSTNMTITSNRRPNLIPLLSYNITSTALTNGLNTSFVKSLGALFTIESGVNDKAVLDIKKIKDTSSLPIIPLGLGGYSNLDIGESIAVASSVQDSLGNSKIVLVSGCPSVNNSSGAVVVFVSDASNRPAGWSQPHDIIIPTNTIGISKFGCSVDITNDGLTLVIGGKDDDVEFTGGAIWIYRLINSSMLYVQSQKILRSTYSGFEGALYGSIGYTVSISDDGVTIVSGSYSFSAKVFTKQSNGNYTLTNQLMHSNVTSLQQLSACRNVSISKDGLVIAASAPAYFFSRGGAALWYKNVNDGTWNESIVASTSSFSMGGANLSSSSISMSSTTAVGSGSFPCLYICISHTTHNNIGAAVVIQLNTTDISNLVKANEVVIQPSSIVNFGKSSFVTYDGTKVIIGANYEDITGTFSDSKIYMFERTTSTDNTWTELTPITWPTGELSNNDSVTTGFGSSLAMVRGNNNWVLAGATEVDYEVGCVFDLTPGGTPEYKKLQPNEILGTGSVYISTSGQGRDIKSNTTNGNILVSSGMLHKNNTGAIWLFENSTGIENGGVFSQVYTNTTFLEGASNGDYFGHAIDLYDPNLSYIYICVSSIGINTVYIYEYSPFTINPSGNTLVFQTITHPETTTGTGFGEDVCFSTNGSILTITDSYLHKCYVYSNGNVLGDSYTLIATLSPITDLNIDITGYSTGIDKLFETVCVSNDGSVIAGVSNSYQGYVYKYLLVIYENTSGVVGNYTLTHSVYLGSDNTDSEYTRASRNSCDISSDGTILAVGIPYNDLTGFFKVYRKTNSLWVEDTVDPVQSTVVGTTIAFNNLLNINATKNINALGSGISLSDDNLRIYVSDIYDNGNNGAAHVFTYNSNRWEWIQKIASNGVDTFNASSLTISRFNNTNTEDILFKAGSVVGNSYAIIPQVYSSSEFTVSAREYTATDLALEVQRRCNNEISQTTGNSTWTVALNETTETITATVNPLTATSDTIEFLINANTTLATSVLWTPVSTEYSTSKESNRLDLSMNNNLLKSITISQTGVISYDNLNDLTTRRYNPGFSLTDLTEIDIQLRNERDQIIDLSGLDWSFLAYASIYDH